MFRKLQPRLTKLCEGQLIGTRRVIAPSLIARHKQWSQTSRCMTTKPPVAWLSERLSKQLSRMGALELIRSAADKGDDKAMALMGVCHAMGRDVPKDEALAVEWFRKSVAKGNPEAALALGLWTLEGKGGLAIDRAKAAQLLEIAANQGVPQAQTMLGILLQEEGGAAPPDPKKAARMFSLAAGAGDPRATYNLGVAYDKGLGVPQDIPKATELIRKAAVLGLAEAQYAISQWYRDAEMDPARARVVGKKAEFLKRAFEWCLKAAKQGHVIAMYNVGVACMDGMGTEADAKAAAEWYAKAAAGGQLESMCNLGTCYLNGTGVELNKEEGLKWYLKSAQAGYVLSQFNAAVCYSVGLGTAKDDVKAFEWLEKAADQSFVPAMEQLGHCYKEGRGVAKDEVTGDLWIKFATQSAGTPQGPLPPRPPPRVFAGGPTVTIAEPEGSNDPLAAAAMEASVAAADLEMPPDSDEDPPVAADQGGDKGPVADGAKPA